MMKCASLLAVLPAAAVAFQNTAPIHRVSPTPGIVTLGDRAGENQTPGLLTLVDRADECAIHYGFCDIDELETLADEVHKLQGRDRQKVYQILHMQSELRRMMERYAMGDEQGGPDETSGTYDDYLRFHW